MSTPWSIFVIVLVVLNVGACIWLIRWTMNMRTADETDESTGHTWDVDLKEYNNPLPKWWLNTFWLTIIFTVIYLVLYPGFGNFDGILGWSQIDQYEAQVAKAEKRLDEVYAAFRDRPIAELADDPDALDIGANTYMNFCAQCHGADARGALGFPNLTDSEWLWGGSADAVYTTIVNGRTGNMPALAGVVGEEGAGRIADWLLSENPDAPDVAAGKQKYMTSGCIGCHGMNAEGNPLLGAPNLRNDIWLHGGSREQIVDVILNGRVNRMPAQLGIIGEDRARVTAAYVLSLGGSSD